MNELRKFELAVPVSAVDHALGASHAPVTVVEYGDFECPNCKQAAPAVRLLLERFPGRVRLVYRHFPLEKSIRMPCMPRSPRKWRPDREKFWPMHDLLFDNQAPSQAAAAARLRAAPGARLLRYDAGDGGRSTCSASASRSRAASVAACAPRRPLSQWSHPGRFVRPAGAGSRSRSRVASVTQPSAVSTRSGRKGVCRTRAPLAA